MILKTKKENIIKIFEALNEDPLSPVSLNKIVKPYYDNIKDIAVSYSDFAKEKLFIKSRYKTQREKYGELVDLYLIDSDTGDIYSALFKIKSNKEYILQSSFIKKEDFYNPNENSKIGYYFDYDNPYIMHKEANVTLMTKGLSDINVIVSKSLHEKLPCSPDILKSLFVNLLSGHNFQDDIDMLFLLGDIDEIKSMLTVNQDFLKISFNGLKKVENNYDSKNENNSHKNKI